MSRPKAKNKTHADLLASETRSRSVIEASPDAFLFFRIVQGKRTEIADFEVEDINSSAERLLGRTRSELLKMSLERDFPVKDPILRDRIRRAIETGQTFEAEFHATQGEIAGRWIRVQGVPLPDGIAVFLRDISHRKIAEEIIQEQRRTIVNTSKLSALGEMAAGIAHEINNPLAIIQACADQLSTLADVGKLDSDAVLRVADRIHTTVSRVGKVIRGLRSFARDGENDPLERGSIEKIVLETLEFCQERFRNHEIRLRTSLIDSAWQIRCRPTAVSQVILNLLNNSFDAVLGQREKWVNVDVIESAHRYLIRVSDSGPPIPQGVREKIMQPFFTTKELGKGTGLGLSIARGIVEAHGGALYLDASQINTTFVVELPKWAPVQGQNENKEAA